MECIYIENEKRKTDQSTQSMPAELSRLQQYISTHKLCTATGSASQSENDAATRGSGIAQRDMQQWQQ